MTGEHDALDAFGVPDALVGERVDRAVALVTGWSRADVQALVEQRAVLVDGQVVAKSRRLAVGEVVELLAGPVPVGPPGPEPIDLVVVLEDPEVVVVDKPAGLVVHPGAGHGAGTLVNGLLDRYPELAAVGDPLRPGLVHRLDRDTSGLLVVARTAAAYESLVAQLAARTVRREYATVVWGVPSAARGVIDAPIGRSTSRRTRMAVRTEGRAARTEYVVEETFDDPACARLVCRLETGRTHQIRVHLAAIGHPVVGDPAYGGTRPQLAVGRPFLHAATLAFAHPRTGAEVRCESPLPPELATVLARLRASARS